MKKKFWEKKIIILFAYEAPGLPMSVHKNFQPIRSSPLAGSKEVSTSCFINLCWKLAGAKELINRLNSKFSNPFISATWWVTLWYFKLCLLFLTEMSKIHEIGLCRKLGYEASFQFLCKKKSRPDRDNAACFLISTWSHVIQYLTFIFSAIILEI